MVTATVSTTRLRRAHTPLLLALAWKNVRLRYKSSLLGFVWTLLNPLLFLGIFLLIFGQAFPQVPNYAVFALTGLVFWTFFSTVSGHMLGALVENANVLKSLAVPPLAFPLGQLLAGLFNLALSFLPLAFILAWFGWRPMPSHLLIVPATALFALFIYGLGLGLCALNVYFRDIGLLWNALLPAFFYLTPIAYPPELVPDRLRWIAELNPLYHFITLVRAIIVEGVVPSVHGWGTAALFAVVALGIGMSLHNLLRRGYIANY